MNEMIVLFSAYVLDCLIGDPAYRWHPVRLMGKLIRVGERILFKAGFSEYVGGFLLLLLVSGVSVLTALMMVQVADTRFPFAGMLISVYLVYSMIGLRDLLNHAAPVQNALRDNGLDAARHHVQRFVGRDADRLDAAGIARAAVESVAENFVDGFLGVVFWFVCGCLFAGGAGWPATPVAVMCVMFYRAINTLDAMIGYKNDRYRKFGFISAKTDDFLNFAPARLSVPVILAAAFLCGYDAQNGLRIVRRDRRKHASPNSGHPESAIAGVLGVRLGGPVIYPFGYADKAWLGDDVTKITPDHIYCTGRIIFCAAGISMVIAVAVLAVFDRFI